MRIDRVLEQFQLKARVEAAGTRPELRAVDVTADFLSQVVRPGQDLGCDEAENAFAISGHASGAVAA